VAEILGMPISYLIFAGDMLVMAFMIVVVVWVSMRANDEQIAAAARIPLQDADAGPKLAKLNSSTDAREPRRAPHAE